MKDSGKFFEEYEEKYEELISELTYWHEPQKRVVSKHGAHVVAEAPVVWLLNVERLVLFVALLAEFNRCVRLGHQVEMEREEQSHEERDCHGKNV